MTKQYALNRIVDTVIDDDRSRTRINQLLIKSGHYSVFDTCVIFRDITTIMTDNGYGQGSIDRVTHTVMHHMTDLVLALPPVTNKHLIEVNPSRASVDTYDRLTNLVMWLVDHPHQVDHTVKRIICDTFAWVIFDDRTFVDGSDEPVDDECVDEVYSIIDAQFDVMRIVIRDLCFDDETYDRVNREIINATLTQVS